MTTYVSSGYSSRNNMMAKFNSRRSRVTPDDHFGGITTLYDGTKGEDEGSMKDEKVVE